MAALQAEREAAEAARDKAMEEAKDNRARANVARNYSRQFKEFDRRQNQLEQSQADLDKNRWGNTDIPNAGAGMGTRWTVDKDGNPKLWTRAENDRGSDKYYTDPTPSELQAYFKTDENGNVVAKSHEEVAQGVTDAINRQADAVDKYATPAMKAVAVGTTAVIAAPAVGVAGKAIIHTGKATVTAATTYYINNSQQVNDVVKGTIDGIVPGAPSPSPLSTVKTYAIPWAVGNVVGDEMRSW